MYQLGLFFFSFCRHVCQSTRVLLLTKIFKATQCYVIFVGQLAVISSILLLYATYTKAAVSKINLHFKICLPILPMLAATVLAELTTN